MGAREQAYARTHKWRCSKPRDQAHHGWRQDMNKLARELPRAGRNLWKRLIGRKMKEDKNWNKMVVLPPVNSGLALPLIASKFSLIANQHPTRKPFPWKLPKPLTLSPNHAARLLLASFSPKRSRSKPFSTIPSTCRNNQQQRQWRSVGFEPECPRASYSRHEREREQVASRPPTSRAVRAHRPRQLRDTLDSR
jgi:hypothetical protein